MFCYGNIRFGFQQTQYEDEDNYMLGNVYKIWNIH